MGHQYVGDDILYNLMANNFRLKWWTIWNKLSYNLLKVNQDPFVFVISLITYFRNYFEHIWLV